MLEMIAGWIGFPVLAPIAIEFKNAASLLTRKPLVQQDFIKVLRTVEVGSE